MKSLTVAYITSRFNPKLEWFLDSLKNQLKAGESVEVIIVDSFPDCHTHDHQIPNISKIQVQPKPTVWQGEYRLTKDNWWAKSNALNTAICLCKTEWISFLDDRCVLLDGWLERIKSAMAGNYAVCGSYEKRINMTVENGVIQNGGIITGKDCRDMGVTQPIPCGGEWLFGCNFALPLEWALNVNGFEELLDGLSSEDTQFGAMLSNNGYPLKFDVKMKIIEDRTSSEIGAAMKRTSKERWGNDEQDKGHEAIRRFHGNKQAQHGFNIRELRAKVLAGEPFPIPDKTKEHRDWFDGMLIKDFDNITP